MRLNSETGDKLILTSLFLVLLVTIKWGSNSHDLELFLIGSGTTILGGLLGMMRGNSRAAQQNVITNSDVSQPVEQPKS